MSKRISPSQRLQAEIDGVFAGGEDLAGAIEQVAVLGARLLLQTAIKAEVTAFLGRDEAAAVSKSTVSRICDDIRTQFESWSQRRLDDVELDYLFLDGSHFKYHPNASSEPVLAGWGIDIDGKPVFVGLEAAASESGDGWEGFLRALGERGLACPLLVSATEHPD